MNSKETAPTNQPEDNPNRVDESAEHARRVVGMSSEDIAALGGLSLGASLSEGAARTRETNTLPERGLEAITNPETKAAFEQAFAESAELYARVGRHVPNETELDSLLGLARLARLYEAEQAAGREPEIVLANYGLGYQEWDKIYQSLADDRGIKYSARKPLDIDSEVRRNWHEFARATFPRSARRISADGSIWGFRIIPGTNRPPETDVRRNDNGDIHPSIPEYLALQAIRLQAGKPRIDSNNTGTRLGGRYVLTGSEEPYLVDNYNAWVLTGSLSPQPRRRRLSPQVVIGLTRQNQLKPNVGVRPSVH